jgi:hypothetical protein
MIVASIALALIAQTPVADFFPLQPGMSWTYEITGDRPSVDRQKVGAPIEAAGKMIPPVLILAETGKTLQTTFYERTDTGVFVLGHDAKNLFLKPQPVFQFDPKGANWEFEGPSPYEDDKESGMKMVGQSKLIGQRSYLGEQRDCLEVKTETKIGLTVSTATTFKQTAIYAKGLGMVEMDESAQQGRRTTRRKVKIIKFEPGEATRQ